MINYLSYDKQLRKIIRITLKAQVIQPGLYALLSLEGASLYVSSPFPYLYNIIYNLNILQHNFWTFFKSIFLSPKISIFF